MFEGCTSLTEVVFKGLGNTVAYMDYVGPYYFAGCTSLPAITLADRAAICDNAFDGCTALAFVSFGGSNGVEDSTLRMLGDYAFRNCTENWAMLLPKLPAYIGEHVFDGWTAQQAMKTHESIEEIKKLLSTGMFKGCNAEVYDKDMVLIEIDPETGLLKETP
jgi:hypothetical protein